MKPSRESVSTLATARVSDTASSRGALSLKVIDGTLVTSYSLPPEGTVVLGRSHEADVRIESPSLSRRHAALHLGTPMRIEDLGSANGTKLANRSIAAGAPVEVGVGEAIGLGSVLVIVQYDGAPPPALASSAVPAEGSLLLPLDAAGLRVAGSKLSVLLLGETGVGKEVTAEAIHRRSPRAGKPMLRLNCAAFSVHLLESELFGYERGAFTGADHVKPGLLETASGGTVFLDEVGELPLTLQAKLLRVFEQQSVMRVGGMSERAIDVRFIAATNRDLKAAIAAGRFRQDLYFRLNGFSLTIPPLRERRHQIEPLARLFVAEASKRAGLARAPRVSAAAMELLPEHPWPGNIRELKNVIERGVVLCIGDVIEREHLPLDTTGPPPRRPSDPAAPERDRLVEALRRAGGNQSLAAKTLGISRGTLLARLDAFGIPRPRKRPQDDG